MKRFEFTLKSVLTVKEKLLENERLKLAHIMGVLDIQKESYKTIENMLIRYQQELQELVLKGDLNPILMDSYNSYIGKLTKDLLSQKALIQKTQKELEIQQNKTKEAYIKVKTLEKLKEKQKENYDIEILKEEIKTIDDIVNSRRIAV